MCTFSMEVVVGGVVWVGRLQPYILGAGGREGEGGRREGGREGWEGEGGREGREKGGREGGEGGGGREEGEGKVREGGRDRGGGEVR